MTHRTRRALRACLALAAVSGAFAASAAGAPVRFHVTEMGSWTPTAIGSTGIVVGSFNPPKIWRDGQLSNGPITGGAYAVNGAGDYIVQNRGTHGPQSFKVSGVTTTLLTGADGGSSTQVFAINDNGAYTGVTPATGQGFIARANGVTSPIPNLPDGTFTQPMAMNGKGTVVGFAGRSDGVNHAFLFRGTTTKDLGAFVPGATSQALAVNGDGIATGWSNLTTSPTVYHAFVSRKTGLKDLGTLAPAVPTAVSMGQGINSHGHVVGYSDCASPCTGHRGFYVNGTGMHDINDLLDAPRTTDPVVSIFGINDDEQMAGVTANGVAVLIERVR